MGACVLRASDARMLRKHSRHNQKMDDRLLFSAFCGPSREQDIWDILSKISQNTPQPRLRKLPMPCANWKNHFFTPDCELDSKVAFFGQFGGTSHFNCIRSIFNRFSFSGPLSTWLRLTATGKPLPNWFREKNPIFFEKKSIEIFCFFGDSPEFRRPGGVGRLCFFSLVLNWDL